jgi:hypothetical protein
MYKPFDDFAGDYALFGVEETARPIVRNMGNPTKKNAAPARFIEKIDRYIGLACVPISMTNSLRSRSEPHLAQEQWPLAVALLQKVSLPPDP